MTAGDRGLPVIVTGRALGLVASCLTLTGQWWETGDNGTHRLKDHDH
jgi:hypothetical protein